MSGGIGGGSRCRGSGDQEGVRGCGASGLHRGVGHQVSQQWCRGCQGHRGHRGVGIRG